MQRLFDNPKTHIASTIYWMMMVSYKLQQLIYGTYLYPALWTTKHFTLGTNVLDKEWDTLIILDACRVDALRVVADEYNFIDCVDSRWSVGSTSKEWMINTFRDRHLDEINKLGLVTGNGWAEVLFEDPPNWGYWTALKDSYWENHSISKLIARDIVSASDFQTYLPVWENNSRERGNNAPRAEPVTDAAIKVAREDNPERLLVHYMQPHEPYFHKTTPSESLSQTDAKPLEALENGADKTKIWNAYLNNLRYVLDSIEKLITNLDSERMIITADHGELFGELGLYGHVAALPHPHLRKVPWVETQANDTGAYIPDVELQDMKNSTGDVEQRLSDLGYM